MSPPDSVPGGVVPAGPEPSPSWWQAWGLFLVLTGVGWLSVPFFAVLGWVALGGARGVSIAGAPPNTTLGTLFWAGSALLLVGPGCLASFRLWRLEHRLAVAVPVGLAWFALGRFVLPAPGVPGSIRSVAEAVVSLPL